MLNPHEGGINVKVELLNGRIERQIEINGRRCQQLEHELRKIEEQNFD